METAKVLDRFQRLDQKGSVPYMTPSVLLKVFARVLSLYERVADYCHWCATGFRTLAFRTWDRYNEALWHDAGFSGLILLLTAFVITTVTLRWKTNA